MKEPLKPPELFEHDNCPNHDCDGKAADTLGAKVTKQMQDAGMAGENFRYWPSLMHGIVQDRKHQSEIPVGVQLPFVKACFDICLKCGAVWSPKSTFQMAQTTRRPPSGKEPFSKN